MSKIEVEVRIDKHINLEIDVDNVISALNMQPLTKRWNVVANIINEVELSIDELSDSHKEVVRNFLLKKMNLFS